MNNQATEKEVVGKKSAFVKSAEFKENDKSGNHNSGFPGIVEVYKAKGVGQVKGKDGDGNFSNVDDSDEVDVEGGDSKRKRLGQQNKA